MSTTDWGPAEGTGRSLREGRRVTPSQRLWLGSLALLVAAAGLWLATVRSLPALMSPQLPWWSLIPAFFITERWPISITIRRGLPSLALAVGPLVVGVFLVSPTGLLAAFVAGSLLAAVSRRPASLLQSLFGIAQFTVLAGCAEIVVHAVPAVAPFGWRACLAAAAAVSVVVIGNLVTVVMLTAQETRLHPREVGAQLLLACAGALAATCCGLLATALLATQPFEVALVGLLAAALLLLYRRYLQERRDRVALEFLHGAGDALGSRELESAILQLLQRARAMFSAQMAQLTIFPTSAGEKAFRTTVRGDVPEQVMEPLDLSQLDDVVEVESDGIIIERSKASPLMAHMLARRGVQEAMVALLRGESRLLGALLIGGHVDPRSFDARDLQLFRTLAIQTSATLENGRMERSITRLTELQDQLRHQAFHDSLTDLANRALFSQRIDHALQRALRMGRSVAVLFIDVDDFKGVNDTLGHAAGDALLIGIAERLRSSLRRPDTAARLGGDEFAVLIEDLEDAAEAEPIVQRIQATLRTPFEVMGQTVNARVSIGLALSQGQGDNSSNLMRHADVAMYAAKGAGKDRWVAFLPGMEAEIVTRHRLRGDLEQALSLDQFTVHYQPIVDLESGRIASVEALVRWRHPSRGLIAPMEFIPMAEESGIILPLGEHVLRMACAQLLRLQARFPSRPPLSMSVNISARQLEQPQFVESVLETVREIGLQPESLILELTETILLEDAPSNSVKLDALRKAGIRIAIDDFGTGYSSLSYLRRLPVSILKIAKPFVDDLAVAEENGDFARAIVGIGAALRLTLVAEGIEASQQVTQLRALGCTLGQGYHLCHPVSADELQALLESGGIERSRLDPEEALLESVIPLRR